MYSANGQAFKDCVFNLVVLVLGLLKFVLFVY